jgi:hypothetical protein
VIYIDTSVALAYLQAEERQLPQRNWEEPLVSSRLLENEIWNRIHARNTADKHRRAAQAMLDRITLVEMTPTVLARALEPFPIAV